MMDIGVEIKVKQRWIGGKIAPKIISFRTINLVLITKVPIKIYAIGRQTTKLGKAVRIFQWNHIDLVMLTKRQRSGRNQELQNG